MKKNIHKFIAAAAAAAMALMQFSVLPASAFSERDLPIWFYDVTQDVTDPTGASEPSETESTAAEETALPETTDVSPDLPETTSTEQTTTTATTSTTTTEQTTATTSTTASTTILTTTTEQTTTTTTTTQTETTEEPTEPATEETVPVETEPDPAYDEMPDYTRLGAIGNFSPALTQEIAETIFCALYHHEGSIDLSHLQNGRVDFQNDKDSLKNVFYTVAYSTRYGVLTDLHYRYNYVMAFDEPWYISEMKLTYSVPDEMYDAAFEDVSTKIDAILAKVDPDWSAPEKALFLHDYFCIQFNYDYERLYDPSLGSECYTAYGMLINGTAVCHGYAWLYNILLSDLGIESYFVSSAENNHAWNILKLDGCYYHVDCTYDDSAQRSTSQIGLAGQVDHASFLKAHAAMISSGHKCSQYDWVLSTGAPVWTVDNEGIHVPALPTSNRFVDAFWNNTRTGIYPYQNGWLVKEPDPNNRSASCYNLYVYHDDTSESEWIQTILTEANPWYADVEHNRTYSDNYSVCIVDDDIIYYTTNSGSTVMAVEHRNGGGQYEFVWVWLFNLEQEQQATGSIFGMRIEGDTLYYQLAPAVNKKPVEHKCDISGYRTKVHQEAGLKGGDLNGDNQLDVLDIVGMNRYLAGVDTVEDVNIRKRLDLVEDGILDVFDLAMLKKLVLAQS